MGLRVAVQMDPIETVNTGGDSTFALMLKAQARGHRLWHYLATDLSYEAGRVRTRARPLTVTRDGSRHFDWTGETTIIDLGHDTDVVRLAKEAGEELWPAHRIDKVTSGLVVFGRTLAAQGDLTRQWTRRTVEKTYLALTATTGLPQHGLVELPLSVGRKNRVRVAAAREAIVRDGDTWSVPAPEVFGEVSTYPSTTSFERLAADDTHTLLAVTPTTGRRHQIRVHLAWIGHPIAGDPLFDRHATTRVGLHAWRLALESPGASDGRRLALEATPPADFRALSPLREGLGEQVQ